MLPEENVSNAPSANDTFINNFYKRWLKTTKRSGGILVGSSIKELLTEFHKEITSTPVLSWDELKPGDRLLYCETYEVKYNKIRGKWDPKTAIYFGKTKSDHKAVHEKWMRDNDRKQLNLISITYQ